MRREIALCAASCLLISTLCACGGGTSVPLGAPGRGNDTLPLPQPAPIPPPQPAPAPAPATQFVTRQGPSLMEGNQTFRFAGINYYPLGGGPLAAQCSMAQDANTYASKLQDMFTQFAAMQAKVVRLWAFQNYAGPSGEDFSDLDQVVAQAKAANMHVILTLENQWKECTLPSQARDAAFYQGGYATAQGGYKLSYLDYTKKIVDHFKDEPTVLMWQLLNEGESSDAKAMQTFASTMAGVIKGIDPHHLVSVGTLACGGQPGTQPADYKALHADPNIDVLELHDYGDPNDAIPSCWQDDMAVAKALDKPLFVGEAGIDLSQGAPKRAQFMANKLQANATGGGAGFLIWSYGEVDTTYGFSADTHDPLCDTLKQAAQTFYGPSTALP